MGYTRYWKRTDKAYGEDFIREVKAVIGDCFTRGISLANGFGEDFPQADMEKVWLNGIDKNDLGHETLAIFNTTSEHFKEGFDFCKTARKPYDYAVREILKIAERYGLITDVSSDGENEEIISDKGYLLTDIPHRLYVKMNFNKEFHLTNKQKDLLEKIYYLRPEKTSLSDYLTKLEELCNQDSLIKENYEKYRNAIDN